MKSNTYRQGTNMLQNDSQQDPSAYFNIYKVSLTREQQKGISMLLPTKYSFQPYKTTRSLDEESLKSQTKHTKKKQNAIAVKQAKDPDFSISHMPSNSLPKELKPVKVQSTQAIPGGEPYMECYLILKRLKKSLYAWPFKQPVDPKALGIPEYLNIVLQPMDLKTVEQILKRQGYKHPSEFHRDIYKMMMNSYKFNQKNSEVFQATKEFQEEYLKLMKDAKDGKLVCLEKRLKIQENSLQDGISIRQKTSSELPSLSIKPLQKHHTKKQKNEKILQNKSLEKIMARQKQERQRQRQKQKQKQKQKEQNQKVKIQHHQNEKYKSKIFYENFAISQPAHKINQPQEPKVQIKSQFQPDDFMQVKQSKAQSKINREDYEPSFSNQPSKKNKSKSLKQNKNKEKKPKKILQQNQSPNELKELKENTQVENEKSFYFNQIKNKLTDLLKKLNDYQLPNKIKNKAMNKVQGNEQPNFNNFVSITAAQKKKLAEKISLLPNSELKFVIEICFKNKRSKMRDQEGVYQVDLQKLDPKTLKQLNNFVGMRIKKTKKESYKYIKEEIKANQEQQAIQDGQNEGADYIEDQDPEQIQNSLNEHVDESYQNLLQNEVHDFNEYYNNQGNQAPQFQMIDSEINQHRNDYSQEFHF